MNIDKLRALPSTKQFVEKFRLETSKGLSQNFLFDDTITDQILLNLADISGKTVLEIGPGPGGLTRSILYRKPKELVAIELDKRCLPILEIISSAAEGALKIINADALMFDESEIPGKLCIISNLPYNIGTQIVLKWLDNIDKFEFIAVMLQKEVAERLAAKESTEHYGRLSIITQTLCDVDILFDVEPQYFYPPPKVTSTIVRLIPKAQKSDVNLKVLGQITDAAFKMRRKQIKKSLSNFLKEDEFVKLGIEPTMRPEDLSIADFHKIAMYVGGRA